MPYQEDLPFPSKEEENELLEQKPNLDFIMWETRATESFLTSNFGDCLSYASDKYPHNPPPSGQYRELGDYRCFGQLLECIDFNCEANGDGRLLRGEIMTITGIMAGRLRSKRLRAHVVAPMLVLSLMGHCHARVLEADFDGKILNIRASKLYDFTQKNTEFVHSLTRYWLGGACGKIEL
ncbi:hypothetical protein CBS147333_256 [Penicillium roqueforti]|uniref:uncharacterized protein n=1 Tax=Penicillium roqueforti TaxID=5082 RepID=UPI00190E1521|nr:uncharacterized protein LCP9604111_2392 [Penicillium roqueforti]KAF9252396.1 hypothetical protein LCP9604111_2392 [Penicillium roqueforti]KAI3116632.1 hypothetical protein CBS147333_256 [Penicillium roqueforti]KAI3208555.1 hypothetical protein CBS147311_2084 [Penicillium roqueforti]KAI3264855.1 hypothetical protein CBS147308_7910 [Penicillium roqueforti]KAI3297111.1 hypothetical protein DTO003C3_1531 [Penicillium roqueforti]